MSQICSAMAENPCAFNVGDLIRSIYTGDVYRVEKFYGSGNGMCLLYNIRCRATENWNAFNNRRFISCSMGLGIMTSLL